MVISPGVPRHMWWPLCVVVLICVSSFYVLLIYVLSDDFSGLALAVGSQLLLDLFLACCNDVDNKLTPVEENIYVTMHTVHV